MALSKLKQVERMVKIEEPNKYDLKTFKTNFNIEKESGNNVLTVDNLQIGYDKLLSTVSFKLYKSQRLGIIGSNGTGKSTLLKTIVGKERALGGNFELGHNVEIGYFDQQIAQLNSSKTIFDDFYEEFPNLTVTEIRNSLAAFMFYGEDVFKEISMLSGGEKVRLALCKILKRKPNLLILDEPTNHMDIVGKESLENMLSEYKGTLIFVSHDRFFVNKIANCILSFENGQTKFYDYGYEYYLEKREEIVVEDENNKKQEKAKKAVYNNPLKDRGKLQRKIKKLEEEISKKEEEVSSLQKELLQEEIYSDYVKVTEIQEKINSINREIEENMKTWEFTEEEIDRINEILH